MIVEFTKLHGLGNDYLFIDGKTHPSLDAAGLAPTACDRHRGIGADGIIVFSIDPGSTDVVRMAIHNADGSDGGTCGNGLRCLGRLLARDGRLKGDRFTAVTSTGRFEVVLRGDDLVEVDMGVPAFELGSIPAAIPGLDAESVVVDRPLADLGLETTGLPGEARLSLVATGNPHAVVRMPGSCERARLDELVRSVGPSFERHPWFPRRINLHLVSRPPTGPLLMSTWERGSGATQACGTGACAAVVALEAVEPAAEEWTEISLPGGSLEISWAGGRGEAVRQRGPAEEVFRGRLETTTGLASRPRSGEDGRA
ncbi:MAG: diaminopimelate epimerase [Planctomycetota bacterium]|nr:diaminopimelate epimerase [Planctomycetota bacterium]